MKRCMLINTTSILPKDINTLHLQFKSLSLRTFLKIPSVRQGLRGFCVILALTLKPSSSFRHARNPPRSAPGACHERLHDRNSPEYRSRLPHGTRAERCGHDRMHRTACRRRHGRGRGRQRRRSRLTGNRTARAYGRL